MTGNGDRGHGPGNRIETHSGDLHVGIASGADIESTLDLANVLHAAGVQATLYLSRARAARLVHEAGHRAHDAVAARFYELDLIPSAVDVRLIDYPRMRDPRSLAVVHRAVSAMKRDGVDVLHISLGPGELWLAAMAWVASRLHCVPVITAFQQPLQNVGDNRPEWMTTLGNRLAAWGSGTYVVHGAHLVDVMIDTYGLPPDRVVHVPLVPRITASRWPRAGARWA